mgnify:CR=1 FL=1
MTVIVQNQQERVSVTEALAAAAQRAAVEVLSSLGPPTEIELGIIFVDDAAIRRLNGQYRGKDEPTDVLAFPMGEEEPQEDGTKVLLLGDVVISLETAARSIHDLEKGLTAEVERLVVHGTLHLLGYDHETVEDALRMREQEETIMKILLMS